MKDSGKVPIRRVLVKVPVTGQTFKCTTCSVLQTARAVWRRLTGTETWCPSTRLPSYPERHYRWRRRGAFGCGFGWGFGRGRVGFPGLGGTGTPPPPPTNVGGGRLGGARGTCVGSKQSDMSSAVSSRGLMDGMPSKFWQNFNRLMCECCIRETKPLRAYGLITRQGTREP